jgi:N-acyl-D-aspartate/D-glutamate deacylase
MGCFVAGVCFPESVYNSIPTVWWRLIPAIEGRGWAVEENGLPVCDILIRNVQVIDGTGGEPQAASVAVAAGRIRALGKLPDYSSPNSIDGEGKVLAPGFVDVHTHDDLYLIRHPQMLPKLSQGVTTVIVGNCGISASPVGLRGGLPDPMNLLGNADAFRYPTFAAYVEAVNNSQPAVNVAALVGHTSLRSNHMDRLDRVATGKEIAAMRAQLQEALDGGALGLSTGLAYLSANSASSEEVMALAEPLSETGALYATHLRSESETVLQAMDEAYRIGQHAKVPVVISHLKCAGIDNWGRAPELLRSLDAARDRQQVGCDCYPYAASSSNLDLRQVDERVDIMITWCEPYPAMAGQTLAQIAQAWELPQMEAARRLQPAGAIYYGMSEDDVREILRHPGTMIGSDGLPNDPRPHPRLWGTFPRVLGHYCREQKLFSLSEAVRKMTALPAERFGLSGRGLIREGSSADLVLLNAETVRDVATFGDPVRAAEGIEAVWVNGVLSYRSPSYGSQAVTGRRAGRFLPRESVTPTG